MSQPVPVIDLFAGPGGLGEGFSSFSGGDSARRFKIALSIEMDGHAHRTLELRAFTREFPRGKIPPEYYRHLAGALGRDELFAAWPEQAAAARREAWHAELGSVKTPNSEVDRRILEALGSRPKNWVLIGGPPCQAYSLVGRSRVIGGEGLAKYEADPRHSLYKHYLRILAVHQPPVFVMENVKGLLSAKVGNERVFDRILADLKSPTAALPGVTAPGQLRYNLFSLAAARKDASGECEPEEFVLCAEDYGVPQARHRVIILGVRSDLLRKPGVLSAADPVTVKQAIGDLPKLRSGLSKAEDSPANWLAAVREISGAAWFHGHELRYALLESLARIKNDRCRGAEYVAGAAGAAVYPDWFNDPKLPGVCNHETRGHIAADLHRYFFAAVFAGVKRRSPLLEDFPRALLPKHENAKAALKDNKFNDRFRVQLAGRHATTVVSHISKDGHYYIHYDPAQCRSLTVREAARLQTFPDNYLFVGPRTEQYRQVGNAVPPLLANKIASIVSELFERV